ncbi:hypothetical protein HOB10_00155 [Candidatus Parcubacteria bacterium]|jgi:hypothetical protein|nr:hypothetical protein [Candidatus Parcubacteria bacterium]
MEIIFDFSPLTIAASQGAPVLAWYLFSKGGWLVFAWIILRGIYDVWLMRQQGKWFMTNKFVMLAIDVPKDTEQTPKAVEQLFATISGAHAMLNNKEIYLQGMFQLSFSFEIVSMDGYVQFLIRTPSHYRDLVESSIYSQYPDAEITEVEDYVHTAPDKYPNETHKIWGSEIIPVMKEALPIKTYRHFEDMSAEEKFKDPLASLLETMSKVQQGEQVWLQFLVKPTGFEWVKKSMAEAYKIAGKKVATKSSFFSKITKPVTDLLFLSSGESMFYFSDATGSASSNKKDDMPSMMLHLTPGEKSMIEAIEEKAGKIGFDVKIRLIYISPIEQYNAARVVSSVFGSIKQFNTLDLNALKPDPGTKTKINYLFIKYRERLRRERLMRGYKNRSGIAGHNWFVLNIEELASLWHFPSKYIKTPMLQRTESKKSEAPASLPLNLPQTTNEALISRQLEKQLDSGSNDYIPPTEEFPPADESVVDEPLQEKVEDTGFDVDMDNDYFEEHFPKKNTESVKDRPKLKGQPPTNLPTS